MEYAYTRDEEWRLGRLQKATRLVCAILGMTEAQLSTLIAEVADKKGDLHVTWQFPWTQSQELAFSAAWRECKEANVYHTLAFKGVVNGTR